MNSLLKRLAKIGSLVEQVDKELLKLKMSDLVKNVQEIEREIIAKFLQMSTTELPEGELNQEEIDAGLSPGGKIAAIKLYRVRTGKGLVDSKHDVENYFQKKGLTFGTYKSNYDTDEDYPRAY